MTNKLQLIAILTLASILITGGFGLTQLAYSSGSSNDKKDDYKKVEVTKHDDEEEDEHDDKPKTATIKLFKAITTDNRADTPPDFVLTIKNATGFVITIISGATETTIPAGTYTIGESTQPGYRFVLIAGDTQCPSKLDTPFIVKGGDKIECTIYNEDDFVEGQTGGEGIIFQHNSMQVQLSDKTLLDSCDKTTDPTQKDPCIEVISASNGQIGIVDSKLTSDTTIVLFSVIEANRLETTLGAENPVCSISAIVQHDKESFYLRDSMDLSFPSNPTMHNVVVLKCIGMVIGPIMDPETGEEYLPIYNVNYALIDPAL